MEGKNNNFYIFWKQMEINYEFSAIMKYLKLSIYRKKNDLEKS
jgi:hypothetical protein